MVGFAQPGPDFPAKTLIRFLHNHGMLQATRHPSWRVIKGGSSQYIAPLSAPYAERVHLNAEIESISRTAREVTFNWGGGTDRFDHAVFACHGDQVLPLLADATAAERDVLARFRTSRNEPCLHTDERLLPRRSAARASWNYDIDGANGPERPVSP